MAERQPSSDIMVIWRYIAVALLSVTMALAGYFGKSQNDRVTKLEAESSETKIMLKELDTKMDILIRAHRLAAQDEPSRK